jgi:hypothetical protein
VDNFPSALILSKSEDETGLHLPWSYCPPEDRGYLLLNRIFRCLEQWEAGTKGVGGESSDPLKSTLASLFLFNREDGYRER